MTLPWSSAGRSTGVARPTYRGRRLHTTVFMPPVPAKFTSQGKLGVRYDHGDDSVVRAELYYLTPSAWRGDRLGRLRIPVADYHPHYVMHEMSHVVQYSFPGDSKPPAWIIEGIAEYEGFFHTTEYNRTTAIDSLTGRRYSAASPSVAQESQRAAFMPAGR